MECRCEDISTSYQVIEAVVIPGADTPYGRVLFQKRRRLFEEK